MEFNPPAAIEDARRARAAKDEEAKAETAGMWTKGSIAMPHTAEVFTIEEMLERSIYVKEGKCVVTLPPQGFEKCGVPLRLYSIDQFQTNVAASRTAVEGGRAVDTARLWEASPSRKEVPVAGFAIGLPRYYTDPNGVHAINLWTPSTRAPAEGDVSIFLEHMAYLMPVEEEREKFLDWLAHCEQKPQELPHHGYLFYTPTMGIGRNWLADLLMYVWVGEATGNVDLLQLLRTGFNEELGGKRLVCTDEIHMGPDAEIRKMAAQLRQMMTAKSRSINPKYGKKYWERNSLRWLLFTNHEDALPIDEKDRRFAVIANPEEPLSPERYKTLYASCTLEYASTVGAWLAARDISKFNCGARPVMNKAKLDVIKATTSQLENDLIEVLARWKQEGVKAFGSEDLRYALGIDEGFAWTNSAKSLSFALRRQKVHVLGRSFAKGKNERWYTFDPDCEEVQPDAAGHYTDLAKRVAEEREQIGKPLSQRF
jgi:hypothetical protein